MYNQILKLPLSGLGGQGKLSKGLSVGQALKNLKYVHVTEIKFCIVETK